MVNVNNGWKIRLAEEAAELESKIARLQAFIENEEAFSQVEVGQQDLLVIQLSAMNTYLFCLKSRLSRIE